MTTPGYCNHVATRSTFKSFIEAVRDIPADERKNCTSQICGALYGYGNPDVDGIGNLIGYFASNGLGLLIATLLFALQHNMLQRRHKFAREWCRWSLFHRILISMAGAYYDSAIILAFSIQIAATITLMELNFGVTATGMGDFTARVTWAISTVVLIPVMYFAFWPRLCSKDSWTADGRYEPLRGQTITSRQRAAVTLRKDGREKLNERDKLYATRATNIEVDEEDAEEHGKIDDGDSRADFDFLLFVFCWLASLYPFVSRVMSIFGRSEIGHHKTISHQNYAALVQPCFKTGHVMTKLEHQLMAGFGIATSALIFAMTLVKVISMCIKWGLDGESFLSKARDWILKGNSLLARFLRKLGKQFILTVLPLLAVVHFWTILRLQQEQKQMAETAGHQYTEDSMTFGQIMAVTIFVPVILRGVWKGNKYMAEEREHVRMA